MKGAYRTSTEPKCRRCNIVLRDGYELSPSTGEALCPACCMGERLADAEGRLNGADLSCERRCRCGHIASASGTTRVLGLGRDAGRYQQVEVGWDSVFRCARCGAEFKLAERTLRLRFAGRGLLGALLGAVVGALLVHDPFFADAATGALAGAVAGGALFGWRFVADAATRVRHPVVR